MRKTGFLSNDRSVIYKTSIILIIVIVVIITINQSIIIIITHITSEITLQLHKLNCNMTNKKTISK